MAPKRLPEISYVRECVIYDPDTGLFTWRTRPLHHFPCEVAWKWWNTKFANQPAGSGTNSRQNYWRLCLGHSRIKAHRIAWLLVHGEPVPNIIDHVDGDTLNNRISNLRAATSGENSANSKGHYNSTTGAKGVYFRRSNRYRPFVVHIGSKGSRRWLGAFATLEEAITARREAACRLHGVFAKHD